MHITPNPYFNCCFQENLKAKRGLTALPADLVEDIPTSVMDQLLQVLRISAEGETIMDFAHLQRLHKSAYANFEEWVRHGLAKPSDGVELRSITNFLALSMARSQGESSYQWPGILLFARFVNLLPGEQVDQVLELLQRLTGRRNHEIFTPNDMEWFAPLKVRELDDVQSIMGMTYVKNEEGEWCRADEFVQRYHVIAHQISEIEDEGGFYTQDRKITVGMAGTLAGAIEVTELAACSLKPYYSDVLAILQNTPHSLKKSIPGMGALCCHVMSKSMSSALDLVT